MREYSDLNKLKYEYVGYPYLISNAENGNMDSLILKVDLDNGLECLKEDESAVLVYRHFKGYSLRECAEYFGRSVKWVRSREERALVKISHFLLTGMKLTTSQAKQEIKEMKENKDE